MPKNINKKIQVMFIILSYTHSVKTNIFKEISVILSINLNYLYLSLFF